MKTLKRNKINNRGKKWEKFECTLFKARNTNDKHTHEKSSHCHYQGNAKINHNEVSCLFI